jgi:catechol 2,3-dioxygenase-like lactoylglutathione lyase family enzyme
MDMATTNAKTHITQVRTVSVPVSDQEKSLAFYLDTLGFEMRVDAPFGDGNRWIEVAPLGATTTLALVVPAEGNPVGIDTNVRLSTEDAEADHAALKAEGVDVDAEVLNWGGGVPPMFSFRDPDGNQLFIVEQN